uniref:BHLH domain-containing protein n=1 Tax=Arundo donax TaxID=35708 RepID=A0A0A9EZV4_ARUDO
MDKEQGSHRHLDSFKPLDGVPEEQPGGGAEMVDYMLGQAPPATGGQQSQVSSFDKLSFSDVLQFADFGPKLALNQPAVSAGHEDVDGGGDDDDGSYFFRFQALPSSLPAAAPPRGGGQQQHHAEQQEGSKTTGDGGTHDVVSESTTLVQQADGGGGGKGGELQGKSGRRKRPRTVKTSEEVESQRMTHIAVERNRRRQMNEYLRILRALMPGSYVQRGDQASIIGGAIEFIRELEQLIQCLESQKRRRLYGGSGDAPRPVVDAAVASAPTSTQQHQPQPPPFFPPSLPFPVASGGGDSAAKILDLEAGGATGGLREEVAENKSCLGDIEVRALGADATIKILSRRRPGQLIKTIAALEDMQMSILHTNITTIEQTVLYSFNVKIVGEARFSAEDIAGAVHQILSFIDVNYTL